MNVQLILKERDRLQRGKESLRQQYETMMKFLDDQIAMVDTLIEVASRPTPSFNLDFLRSSEQAEPVEAPAPVQVAPVEVEVPAPKVEAPVQETPAQKVELAPEVPERDVEDGEDDPYAGQEKTSVFKSPSAPASATASPLLGSVVMGRGGKPKLVDSMRVTLDAFGPLHPQELADKISEHGLAPNSRKLVEYIRYTLSKNKDIFAKVPGQRGMWQTTAAAARGAAATTPKVESSAPEPDEDEGKPTEIKQIETFRERERTGTIKLSPEEARKLVEEMTDPRQYPISSTS